MRIKELEVISEGPNWGAIDTDVPAFGTTPKEPPAKTTPKQTTPKQTTPKAPSAKNNAVDKPQNNTKRSNGRLLIKDRTVQREWDRVDNAFKAKVALAATYYGDKIVVTSGNRTTDEQRRLQKTLPKGRAVDPEDSPHVQSKVACDIRRPTSLPELCVLVAALSLAGIERIGIYDTSLHIDDFAERKIFRSTGGSQGFAFVSKQGLRAKHNRNKMEQSDLRIENYVVD